MVIFEFIVETTCPKIGMSHGKSYPILASSMEFVVQIALVAMILKMVRYALVFLDTK
jgi:hypothetical protein